MTIKNGASSPNAILVGTTPTRLDTAVEGGADGVSAIAIYNNGAATVYLGGADVTTTGGVPVAASSWGPGMDMLASEGLYGIVAAGTVEVRVLETGV